MERKGDKSRKARLRRVERAKGGDKGDRATVQRVKSLCRIVRYQEAILEGVRENERKAVDRKGRAGWLAGWLGGRDGWFAG